MMIRKTDVKKKLFSLCALGCLPQVLAPLELGEGGVRCPGAGVTGGTCDLKWALGAELGSSSRVESALSHGALQTQG